MPREQLSQKWEKNTRYDIISDQPWKPKWLFPPGAFSSSFPWSRTLPLNKVNSFQWWEARRSVADNENPKHTDHFTQIQKLLTKPSLFSINNAFEIILTPISGRQVVVGGWDGNYLSSVETYPPLQEGCSIPALEEARYDSSLSILPGNRLVVCGGYDGRGTDLASCVSWTPGQEKWSSFANMRWQSLFVGNLWWLLDGDCKVVWGWF